jgi:hypothetical protein
MRSRDSIKLWMGLKSDHLELPENLKALGTTHPSSPLQVQLPQEASEGLNKWDLRPLGGIKIDKLIVRLKL